MFNRLVSRGVFRRMAAVAGTVACATCLLAGGSAFASERITIGTGSTGGVYYPLGGGMAQIFSNTIDGVSATAEVTGASIENSRRVGNGEMTLGIGNANTVYFAKEGINGFRQSYPLQAMAALYPSTFQLVVRADSGIDSIEDLDGKRVAVGPPGGATRVMADAVFEAYGIKIAPQYLDFTEATESLKDRNLDASVVLAAFPTPTVIDLGTTAKIKVLSISDDMVAKIHKEYPYYIGGQLPGEVYDGVGDVQTIQIWNILFANADADQDMIYKMTKAIFDNHDKLKAIHPAAKQIQAKTAVNVPIPLAPGAKKYYQEVGALK